MLSRIGRGFALAAVAAAVAAVSAAAGPLNWDQGRSLVDAVAYRNLAVIPVVGPAKAGATSYQTLDQAVRARTLVIREMGNGGSVNQLTVTNKGKHKVYLMAGEVVLGGQQDRLIGQDVIVPPSKKGVRIPVYCVENGRWTGSAQFQTSASAVAAQGIRLSAQEGTSAAPAPSGAHGRRASIAQGRTLGGAQEQVWDQVAKRNLALKASPSTGTYREVVSLQAPGVAGRVNGYIRALSGVASSRPNVVGAVIAVNGKVVAADIFQDAALFRALWPKLLRGYAAEAVEGYSPSARAGARRATAADALAFLREASDGKARTNAVHLGGIAQRVESNGSLTYSMHAGASAGGAALHTNILRKR